MVKVDCNKIEMDIKPLTGEELETFQILAAKNIRLAIAYVIKIEKVKLAKCD